MTIPSLHRFLGLAGIYARLDSLAAGLRAHAATILEQRARLQTQEQAMSRTTIALTAIAAAFITISNNQAKEAQEKQEFAAQVKELNDRVKANGGDFTDIEASQLDDLATKAASLADASNASAKAMQDLVDSLPDEAMEPQPTDPTSVASTTSSAPVASTDPVATTTDPTGTGLDVPSVAL